MLSWNHLITFRRVSFCLDFPQSFTRHCGEDFSQSFPRLCGEDFSWVRKKNTKTSLSYSQDFFFNWPRHINSATIWLSGQNTNTITGNRFSLGAAMFMHFSRKELKMWAVLRSYLKNFEYLNRFFLHQYFIFHLMGYCFHCMRRISSHLLLDISVKVLLYITFLNSDLIQVI